MINRVEKYFSFLTNDQLNKVVEIATSMISKGVPADGKFCIKFAGDVSKNPEEVIDLIPSNVDSESTFDLITFANANYFTTTTTQSSNVTKITSSMKKQRKSEIGAIGMAAVRTMITTHGKNQKQNVVSNLTKNLQEIKTRYA